MLETKTKSQTRVFISSTVEDLPEHRAAVVDACLRVGVQPVVMDAGAATDSDELILSRTLTNEADIYIGILAFRYGYVPPGQDKSIMEIEYQHAVEKGIPRLIFIMSGDHPIRAQDVETGPGAEKLRSFKSDILRNSLVMEFRSAEELKAAVTTALVEVLHSPSRQSAHPTTLLLLPFGEKHESLRRFLSAQLGRHGVQVVRLDAIEPGAFWVNAVTDAIRRADFVIVDVTDANPNLMYELGYVHALRKPTILLANSEVIGRLPSNLRSYQILTYDEEGFASLERPLARFLREYAKGGW